jgi:hypothetical protein
MHIYIQPGVQVPSFQGKKKAAPKGAASCGFKTEIIEQSLTE